MQATNLTELKATFFKRFSDPAYFNCAEFNLLKVVLDGLKVNYAGRGVKYSDFFGSSIWQKLKNNIKRRRNAARTPDPTDILCGLRQRSYIFVDSAGRTSQNAGNRAVSLYFEKIKRSLGPEGMAHLVENPDAPQHEFDLLTSKALYYVLGRKPDTDDLRLKDDLLSFYNRISAGGSFDKKELLNICIALEKFYQEYRQWKYILSLLPQQNIFLICHYHKEGAILAMRRAKRKIIELQHGLISKSDLFYCFPPLVSMIRERALFPDTLLVFGNFWKKKLAGAGEFAADDIRVLGDYRFSAPASNAHAAPNKPIVLVCTQVFLHSYFVQFIQNLSGKYLLSRPEAEIWIKPHPAEDKSVYSEIEALSNVRVVQGAVRDLLKQASCQVSIYSTTLYEGIQLGVPGFSLDVPSCRNYVEELATDRISTLIGLDDDPLAGAAPSGGPKYEELFADFDVSALHAAAG